MHLHKPNWDFDLLCSQQILCRAKWINVSWFAKMHVVRFWFILMNDALIKLLAFCLIINYNPPSPHTHNPYKPTSSLYLLSYLLSFLVCHQTILRKYIVIFMNNCKNIIQRNIIVLSKFLYTSLHAIIVLIDVF